MNVSRRLLIFAMGLSALSCKKDESVAAPAPVPTGPVGVAIAAPSGASRLTRSQYAAAIHSLFGNEIVVPSALEPDVQLDGFDAIGARSSTVSTRGVEQYETAAFAVGNQLIADSKLLARVLVCKPVGVDDAVCARTFVSSLLPKVYRRPVTDAEVAKITGIVTTAGKTLGAFEKGIVYGVAAMLQSPHFLYRPAVGEADPEHPGQKRYSATEFATRLAIFLWNNIPDDALLDAAKTGQLNTYAGVSKEVDRMLASPKAREGVRNFVTEWFRLNDLDFLQKDSKLFTTYTPELGGMAREETLRVVEDIVFDRNADVRELVTTRRTFVNPKLAAMYQIAAPTATGFAQVDLPEDGARRGLLGQISFLALAAHPTSTSATLRGKFVREKLLCQLIPPPPVGLNTALPEPTDKAKTLRDRVQIHFTSPGCSSCHKLTDPIGLGFEQFDGIGRARVKENGVLIDATGVLDEVAFDGPKTLAQVIFDHPKFAGCIVRKVVQYATGATPDDKYDATLTALTERFTAQGFRLKSLLATVATSPAFRAFGAPSISGEK